MAKNLPAIEELPWVGKILWRRKWQPTPASLPGNSHGQRSLMGYSWWGHKRLGHDLATKNKINPIFNLPCKSYLLWVIFTYSVICLSPSFFYIVCTMLVDRGRKLSFRCRRFFIDWILQVTISNEGMKLPPTEVTVNRKLATSLLTLKHICYTSSLKVLTINILKDYNGMWYVSDDPQSSIVLFSVCLI